MAPAPDSTRKSQVVIYGLIRDAGFQQASLAADFIHDRFPDNFAKPTSVGFLECDWVSYVASLKKEKGKGAWGFQGTTVVLIDDELCGDEEAFLALAMQDYEYEEFRPLPFFHALAKEEYKTHLLGTKHDFVYLTISSENTTDRLVIELFTDKCPRTCENFKQLCIGKHVDATRRDPPCHLTYKSSIIHRIVKNGWIQGGDVVAGKGDDGESMYGACFDDENFAVEHSKRGIVGMANKGPHTNSSQFYITLQPAHWMDRKYVAFGQVIEGSHLMTMLENQETYNERPQTEWRVTDCGVVNVTDMFSV